MKPLRRFTIASGRIEEGRAWFDPAETRHMARVLRLAPGDLVLAGDGHGRDYTVRIETLGETATGTVLGVADNRAESPVAITLVQGIPKGDKMEQIVRAATELGVHRVAPALAERTIIRLEPARWRERARRWQRVAREAAKQCGRSMIPEVDAPRPLVARLADRGDLNVCLWEGEGVPFGALLDGLAAPPRTVSVAVGPEGGLAREEVEEAVRQGWHVVRLGPRILRTETAGPAIVAILQFRLGDLARTTASGDAARA